MTTQQCIIEEKEREFIESGFAVTPEERSRVNTGTAEWFRQALTEIAEHAKQEERDLMLNRIIDRIEDNEEKEKLLSYLPEIQDKN